MILERAKDALSLPDTRYPKERLLSLIAKLIHRWPELRGPKEQPVEMFATEGDVVTGTTNVDFTARLWGALNELRSSRDTWLRVGAEGFEVKTRGAGGRFEQKVDLPDNWVRGFLQVTGAMAMPGLPSFYAVKLPDMTFVLGLSGWSGQSWTDAGSFDLLGDTTPVSAEVIAQVHRELASRFHATPKRTRRGTGATTRSHLACV